MFPSPFDYVAASSVGEAIALLGEHGPDAKLLAGGHSLLPMMKLRLATPAVLVDLGRVADLAGVQARNGTVMLGALTTYTALIGDPDLAAACPLVRETASHVGDMQVRNRGTIGGSLAHADPAADMPAAMLALDAVITLQGPAGERTVEVGEFFQGLFSTVLAPDEVLISVTLPRPGPRTGMAYEKVRNPASGYAIVGVAAVVALDAAGVVAEARVGITGAGTQPTRAVAVEDALRGRVADPAALAAAAALAAEGLDIMGDLQASEAYRAHLTRVHTRRALQRAVERAGGAPR